MKPRVVSEFKNDSEFDALVLLLPETGLESNSLFTELDNKCCGSLKSEAIECQFLAKRLQLVSISVRNRLPFKRMLLVGLGNPKEVEKVDFKKVGALCAREAMKYGLQTITVDWQEKSLAAVEDVTSARLQRVYEGFLLARYKFDRYKSERSGGSTQEFDLTFVGEGLGSVVGVDFEESERLVKAIETARDWVNEPAAVLTPKALSERAIEWLEKTGVESTVFEGSGLQKEGMGMVLGVGKGSDLDPCLVHAWYKPNSPRKKIVLVGKGVTFDSGGYSLKPSEGMKDMKGDMAGAAVVLSTIRLVAESKLAIEVHAIAPCAENMVSGRSYRLGDVLRSRSGKTVEITNTDAEGRLLLADALDYARDLKPDLIIDFATLTGACVVALGPFIAGVMGTDEEGILKWIEVGKKVGEGMWPLPLPENLKEQLKSEIADFRNAGDRWGGALIAGLFLKEFVGETPWFHVDIAGPAFADKESAEFSKGGTGFGIATLYEFLKSYSSS